IKEMKPKQTTGSSGTRNQSGRLVRFQAPFRVAAFGALRFKGRPPAILTFWRNLEAAPNLLKKR
ncbi:MAG: hypothetical protein PVF59_01765, partial [Desulfobacterales bacterium]